jgi:group I intron endonuclease
MNISKALQKYGYSNFSFEIIEYCESNSDKLKLKTELFQREQYFFDLLKPEYNILAAAGSLLGFKHSLETRAKLSAGMIGKIFSEETRAKMSEAKKGKVHSEEALAKMSEAKKDKNHPMYGKIIFFTLAV